ncbi:MAG: hypothetical protein COW24_00385 [Candidatus Kerfeldbacteria bacterium CG15_BIG_FIL_POST_REV_8_21_14_020_45_12]|uniref:Regulator of chromosome condensation n=1 Tax=Candidatus Kerfeldbacteria bacterium CG15_BIG_FIL_POST_REV_8_21_14_020_45_12 TaxID=2014247 RepID=A0A2M7H596_9BACT|nr:MAG: hypothetical protein COW24_00385 [Candidatus Kerfeldbacteria bacterium CG15_BIG_FIL_POST_REV_8_21_14_020_45_12]PJA92798.1 MAG: hypothetical protein CO132_06015 [Candidatus Kerfeldbacteria bacterium CG_4_9_14_3_um_filter_45_8]
MRYILLIMLPWLVGCGNLDADNDGYPLSVDCGDRPHHDYSQPTRPYDGTGMDGRDIYPDAPDVPYDGIDANCWGDDDFDADHDGHRSNRYGGDDCDDFDQLVFPGALEHCDNVDNDCDGTVDEEPTNSSFGVTRFYWDHDGDGYAGDRESVLACNAPSGYFAQAGDDCDDDDSSVHPGATEYCDGVDNDCDGTSDGDTAVDQTTWYLDYDGDDYAGDLISLLKCEETLTATEAQWYVAESPDDCDDLDGGAYPEAPEECNEVDDDCDGAVDEDLECPEE